MDYLLLDKTGTLATGDFFINSIIVNQQCYDIDWQNMDSMLYDRQQRLKQQRELEQESDYATDDQLPVTTTRDQVIKNSIFM